MINMLLYMSLALLVAVVVGVILFIVLRKLYQPDFSLIVTRFDAFEKGYRNVLSIY